MVNIFPRRCPDRSGVGAIDYPDRFAQVRDQHYIPDVTEKIFRDDISMIHRQKTFIFGVLPWLFSYFTPPRSLRALSRRGSTAGGG